MAGPKRGQPLLVVARRHVAQEVPPICDATHCFISSPEMESAFLPGRARHAAIAQGTLSNSATEFAQYALLTMPTENPARSYSPFL